MSSQKEKASTSSGPTIEEKPKVQMKTEVEEVRPLTEKPKKTEMTEGHPLTKMPKKTEVKEVRPLTERGTVKDFDPIYEPAARDADVDVFNRPRRPKRESKPDPSALFSRGAAEDVFNIPKRPKRESKADPSAIFSRGSAREDEEKKK